MDYNPHLQPWKRSEPNKEAGKGSIEIPDEIENIVHQTRCAHPLTSKTSWERRSSQFLVMALPNWQISLIA